MTLDEKDGLNILQRMDEGDREAIYDAVVEAVTELDALRELIGCALSDSDHDVLARIAEVNAARACTATICSSRWNKEPASKDRRGEERKRNSASQGATPANHG